MLVFTIRSAHKKVEQNYLLDPICIVGQKLKFCAPKVRLFEIT